MKQGKPRAIGSQRCKCVEQQQTWRRARVVTVLPVALVRVRFASVIARRARRHEVHLRSRFRSVGIEPNVFGAKPSGKRQALLRNRITRLAGRPSFLRAACACALAASLRRLRGGHASGSKLMRAQRREQARSTVCCQLTAFLLLRLLHSSVSWCCQRFDSKLQQSTIASVGIEVKFRIGHRLATCCQRWDS